MATYYVPAFKFWGRDISPNSKITFCPPKGFLLHISQATLSDISNFDSPNRAMISVITGGVRTVICNLIQKYCENYSFDLVFPPQVPITFFNSGKCSTSLSGYLQPLDIIESLNQQQNSKCASLNLNNQTANHFKQNFTSGAELNSEKSDILKANKNGVLNYIGEDKKIKNNESPNGVFSGPTSNSEIFSESSSENLKNDNLVNFNKVNDKLSLVNKDYNSQNDSDFEPKNNSETTISYSNSFDQNNSFYSENSQSSSKNDKINENNKINQNNQYLDNLSKNNENNKNLDKNNENNKNLDKNGENNKNLDKNLNKDGENNENSKKQIDIKNSKKSPKKLKIYGKKDENSTKNLKISKNNKNNKKKWIDQKGIRFFDLEEGSGRAVKKGDLIKVLFAEKNSKGKITNSNTNLNKPFVFKFGLGEVMKGWDIGLEGIKYGGKRKIVVPGKYGLNAANSFKQREKMIYTVKVLE